MKDTQFSDWTLEVTPRTRWLDIDLREIWRYRDLLTLFIKRDIVITYKQTVLGPLWFFIQPILTTVMFTIVFGNIAKIPTGGVPPLLFYLSAIIAWNYFAECLKTTSDAFKKNEDIFGKVYFPRIIMPLAIVSANLVKFGIQFLLFLGFWLFFFLKGTDLYIRPEVLVLPILILMIAGLGLGFGMLISSLTTKYRDLNFLIQFGIQLAMYATPVIYPLETAPEAYRTLILANPMTAIIEAFRHIFLGAGSFSLINLSYSLASMLLILFLGLIVFQRTEKTFMDTV
ncbi:MAG: ABC transporter permease [Tunicatimonas sp.]|uniref:ABC transporter permease n=1 Tax=Tunicatimonas sp. TaxID=1940096 RepID=UPI003C793CA4